MSVFMESMRHGSESFKKIERIETRGKDSLKYKRKPQYPVRSPLYCGPDVSLTIRTGVRRFHPPSYDSQGETLAERFRGRRDDIRTEVPRFHPPSYDSQGETLAERFRGRRDDIRTEVPRFHPPSYNSQGETLAERFRGRRDDIRTEVPRFHPPSYDSQGETLAERSKPASGSNNHRTPGLDASSHCFAATVSDFGFNVISKSFGQRLPVTNRRSLFAS